MAKPIDTAYRNMVKASTAEGPEARGGKTVTRQEMAAVKAVLEAKVGGISSDDKMKVWRDFRAQTLDAGARKIYNDILGFRPPVNPGPIALYGVAINNAVKTGDVGQIKIMQQLGLETVKKAKAPKAGVMMALAAGGPAAPAASPAKITEIQAALANASKALKNLEG